MIYVVSDDFGVSVIWRCYIDKITYNYSINFDDIIIVFVYVIGNENNGFVKGDIVIFGVINSYCRDTQKRSKKHQISLKSNDLNPFYFKDYRLKV